MEHRCSARKPFQRSVVLDCPRIGLASVTMSDVSLGGMFVETERLPVPLDTPVFVAFNLTHNEQQHDFRLEAMVVRHAPTGAGLMFLELETDVLRALHKVLYEPPMWGMSPAAQTHYEIGGFVTDARDSALIEVR